MTSRELENLVRIGKLKRGSRSARDFDGLVRSGMARLNDASNPALSLVGRFDLAYDDLIRAAEAIRNDLSALPPLPPGDVPV